LNRLRMADRARMPFLPECLLCICSEIFDLLKKCAVTPENSILLHIKNSTPFQEGQVALIFTGTKFSHIFLQNFLCAGGEQIRVFCSRRDGIRRILRPFSRAAAKILKSCVCTAGKKIKREAGKSRLPLLDNPSVSWERSCRFCRVTRLLRRSNYISRLLPSASKMWHTPPAKPKRMEEPDAKLSLWLPSMSMVGTMMMTWLPITLTCR